jgi:hypothetical protein
MQSCRVGRGYLNGFTSKYHADQAEGLETIIVYVPAEVAENGDLGGSILHHLAGQF